MLGALAGLGTLAALILAVLLVMRAGRRRRARKAAVRRSKRAPPELPPNPPSPPVTQADGRAPPASIDVPAALADFHLVEEADLTRKRREELIGSLRRIARPPRSMNGMLSSEVISGDDVKEIVRFIMREPMIAAKILAMVNSPFYGLQSPIASVGQAVTFLGLLTVRNVAVQMLTKKSFKTDDPALQKVCDGLWDAGFIASELCYRLAPAVGMPDQGALSTQTLLAFLGDFAILTLFPAQSGTVNWQSGALARAKAEQRELGIDSGVVGSLLMEEWKLPPGIVGDVRDVVRILVSPPEQFTPERGARLALCYACARIGERIAFGELRDLSGFDFRNEEAPEYFFLNRYFDLRSLARFHDHLHSAGIRTVVDKFVAAAPGPG